MKAQLPELLCRALHHSVTIVIDFDFTTTAGPTIDISMVVFLNRFQLFRIATATHAQYGVGSCSI
jgi:hypothetical protein